VAGKIQPEGLLNQEPNRFRLPLRANELGLLVAIMAVVILTSILDTNHNYWNDPWTSSVDIARQTALLGIFALGAGLVIISGGIDLSSGSMIAFSGTICATIMVLLAPEQMQNAESLGWVIISVAILGTLLVGFLIGTLHTWLITVIELPPFIATLATLVGLRSLGRAICEGVTASAFGGKSSQIQVYDDQFRYLATSVWIPVVIFLTLAFLIWILLSRTVIGRHIYALGGNEEAARLSGIRTERIKWIAYSIGTFTSSIAGILYIADQSVADPQTLGRGYELNAIAASVVGACSLQGGVGTIQGIILGALFLRTVIDGIAKIIKTGADVYEGLIVGALVVVAVAFAQFQKGAGSNRQLFPGIMGGVALITLTLLATILTYLMVNQTAGYTAGTIALLALGGTKLMQSTRSKKA
jgi:ribose/xylose/arabinose/galactoside ABC-type transport system permease subunit